MDLSLNANSQDGREVVFLFFITGYEYYGNISLAVLHCHNHCRTSTTYNIYCMFAASEMILHELKDQCLMDKMQLQ